MSSGSRNGAQQNGTGSKPGSSGHLQPRPAPKSAANGSANGSGGGKPPTQPAPSGQSAPAGGTGRPAAAQGPWNAQPGPSDPAYDGQFSIKMPAEGEKTSATESLKSRVSAAKQAVMDKASDMKDAAARAAERPPGPQSAQTAVQPTAQPMTHQAGQPSAPAAQAPAAHAPAGPTARPGAPAKRPAAKTARSTGPRTRKARLRLARVDPWSVMKTAFLLSIAFGIVTWVAVLVTWSAIDAAGVFDNINRTVSEVLGTGASEPFRIEDYVGTNKVMGFTTLLACADVLIITALATLGAFLYNIAATLLGGLEVTLASED